MLCIKWNVKSVVYSMHVVHTGHLGIGLITIRHAVVSFMGVLRISLGRNFSSISPRRTPESLEGR